MRKILSIVLVGLSVYANARQITPDEAMSVASDFMSSFELRTVTSANPIIRPMKIPGFEKNEAVSPYYIFNRGENDGFVIISGDDCAPKILGYSDKGNFDFDNLPPQLSALLDQFAGQIASLNTTSPDLSWNSSSRTISEDEGKLLDTANWGQGYPYNSQCPIIDGVQAPTGCVATAMAIVMKYKCWPESYDWDSMPIDNVTEDNGNEIALLMADAGKAVFMDYGPTESGALMNWVGHKLQQDFKFSKDCQFITSKNFTSDEWIRMLRSNLDNNQPVIYSGTDVSQSVSHAFVIDGYKGGEYHINWGWDGYCNGYFALDALIPDGNQNFIGNSGMVINIVPDSSGKEYSKCFIDYGYFYPITGNELTTNSALNNVTPSDLSVSVLSVPNGEKGDYALALTDKNGDIKEILRIGNYDVTYQNAGSVEGYSLNFINILPKSIIEYEDRIKIVTRTAGSTQWLDVLGTIETPCEKMISTMTPKTVKVSFEFDENEFFPKYWKGYGVEDFSEPQNGETVDLVYGLSNVQFSVLDASGSYYPEDNILIRIEKSDDGSIEDCYSSSAAFSCNCNIKIKIISLKADKSEKITVEKPGTLEYLCSTIKPQQVGDLSIKGNINAVDLWYIRDNFSNLSELDITESTIFACSERDPIYNQNDDSSEYPDNTLPNHALSGLKKLNFLGLPSNLTCIQNEACSGLALKSIELPEKLVSIKSLAFNFCEDLSIIICRSIIPPTIDESAFANTRVPISSMLLCPTGCLQEYSYNDYFSTNFSEILNDSSIGISDLTKEYRGVVYELIPNGSKITGYMQESLNKDGIIIPDFILFGSTERKVVEIADEAFNYCLTKRIELSENIEKIGLRAFSMTSATEEIILPSKLKEISTGMFGGSSIKQITIPENVELISEAFDGCIHLERLYIPHKAKGSVFHRNMVGSAFESLVEFDVHPNNATWCSVDGILYSKDKSTLFNCPGTKSGILIIPSETKIIETSAFERCSHLSRIRFTGNSISIGYISMNIGYADIDNIEFPKRTYFSNNQSLYIDGLKSMTLGDFTVSTIGSIQCYPKNNQKLKVYLKNDNPVEFAELYMPGCSDWEYFIAGLNNNVRVPNNSQLFVPGGTKNIFETNKDILVEEMWDFRIDRSNRLISIRPEVEGVSIYEVIINGEIVNPIQSFYYPLSSEENPDIVINYTLHALQNMSTHYDAEFMASIPDIDLTVIKGIKFDEENLVLSQGQTLLLNPTITPVPTNNHQIAWSSSDESVATVDENGEVTVVGVGKVMITASCGDVASECTLKCYPQTGDANWNGSITITDAVDISNYIVRKKTAPEGWDQDEWTDFYVAGANANESEDGKITIADASATVRLALAQPAASNARSHIRTNEDLDKSRDVLVIENLSKTADGHVSVALTLDGSREYVALQADIILPEGMNIDVKAGQGAINHSLEIMKFDSNHIRVALFNFGNKALASDNTPILEITTDSDLASTNEIIISNILASDSEANEYSLVARTSGMTGVKNVENGNISIKKVSGCVLVSNAIGKKVEIYTMEGQLVKSFFVEDATETIRLSSGLYVVKAGDRALKVNL